MPVTRQWNATIEHAFAPGQLFSVGYIGSSGRDLLRREIGGLSSDTLVRIALTTNHADSDYHGLQFQYRRRMNRRLQALASYTWSHSIDTGATDGGYHWVGTGAEPANDRGASDFDVRHALSLAFTYETAAPGRGTLARLYRHWALDGIFRARTGFPLNILNAEHPMGVTFSNVFRPDQVPGVPVWLDDPAAPGGRRLNAAAFQPRSGFVQGSLGRNAIAGFGMSQLDLALRRQLPIGERFRLAGAL